MSGLPSVSKSIAGISLKLPNASFTAAQGGLPASVDSTSGIENNLENIENPRSKGRALLGNLKDYWRYRIGDYRLITKIDDGKLLIIALELKHRKKVYE